MRIVLLALVLGWSAAASAQATDDPGGAPVAAPATEGTDLSGVENEGTSSAQSAPAPALPTWQRGSGQHAGGPANELNTGDAKAFEKLPGGSVPRALSGRDLYHGNYCGHGNRGEGVPPTDELDAACMRHDACYDAAGGWSCRCNKVLEREALAVANSARFSRELRARAATVSQAAGLMECKVP